MIVFKRPVKIGERCWLASGSPALNVIDIRDNRILVSWVNDSGDLEYEVISDECLCNFKPKLELDELQDYTTTWMDSWNNRIIYES